MEVKLITTVVILSILLIITIVKYILYRRQIVNICRQMAFIRENNTNKIIYNDIIEREVLKLTDLVNLMCEEHKAKENILKEKDRRLKNALAGISHDIRTPLVGLFFLSHFSSFSHRLIKSPLGKNRSFVKIFSTKTIDCSTIKGYVN